MSKLHLFVEDEMNPGVLAATLFAFTAPVTVTEGQSASTCDPARTLRVLFIGNSYTYVNNVPQLVEQIAATLRGPCVQTGMIAPGGATLRVHWETDSARRRIDEAQWTHVVLQDQSTFGEQWWVDGRFRVGDSAAELMEYATRFAGRVKVVGARPVIFAHWTDDGAPERDQRALDFSFDRVARATGSTLAPVGLAIKTLAREGWSSSPYHADGHHLSPTGSYMTALMLYATLADRSPVGATSRIDGRKVEFQRGIVYRDSVTTLVDLPKSVALRLQRLAASINAGRRGAARSVKQPTSLASEFPRVPERGEAINLDSITGRWSGSTNALPAPAGQQLSVELVMRGNAASDVADSVYLRLPQMEYAGAVTSAVDGRTLVINGSLLARGRARRTAGPAIPFTIEIRVARSGATLQGIATVQQAGSASMPSLYAVGRFEVKAER